MTQHNIRRVFTYKDSYLNTTEARKLLGRINVGESITCVKGSTQETQEDATLSAIEEAYFDDSLAHEQELELRAPLPTFEERDNTESTDQEGETQWKKKDTNLHFNRK